MAGPYDSSGINFLRGLHSPKRLDQFTFQSGMCKCSFSPASLPAVVLCLDDSY